MNRRDTLKDLLTIQERVNRLFEDTTVTGETERESAGTWSPLADMYETDAELVVKAELPEVKQSDIDLRIKDNTLIIEGERTPRRIITEGYHRIERSYGRFVRSFLLPCLVEQDNIKATLKDGILQIVLPKKSEAPPRQVEIMEG